MLDYAQGTSTDTFTNHNWPPEHPPCAVPGTIPAEPVSEHIARQACQSVIGENAHCVFDVMVTGNPGFARTYTLGQSIQANPAAKLCNWTLILTLAGLLLIALIRLLICALRHRRIRTEA